MMGMRDNTLLAFIISSLGRNTASGLLLDQSVKESIRRSHYE